MRALRLTYLFIACLVSSTVLGGGTAYGTSSRTDVVRITPRSFMQITSAQLAHGITVKAGETRSFLVKGDILLTVSNGESATPMFAPAVADSYCPGCPPEKLNKKYEVTACSGVPFIGCTLWHMTLKERFYYVYGADKAGNYGPRKVLHSKKGYAPSYINCNDHGGAGDTVSVDGCKWEGPNPAYRRLGQHITAAAYYQVCAVSNFGPVCTARKIRFADYSDGTVKVST